MNPLINPRFLESREMLKQQRSAATIWKSIDIHVAILNFVVKQAVPATFIDFLQALTLQIHLVKMQYKCITVEICAKTHFHTCNHV